MSRHFLRGSPLAFFLLLVAVVAEAAPEAALVMDARTGRVLYERNADARLHPASLTKMMTLYIVFSEVKRGRLDLDQKVRISAHAARQPPSELGLRTGQRISIRHLIRGAAVKSANDAATALAEAVSGTEGKFAQKMTEVARAMGMTSTTFHNAHGLTRSGHLSTARDMAILGRRLFYDFPEYYNLFSRRATHAGVKTVYNTNRRLLDAYDGADGIKTGYTRAAGSNLVASARRGRERVIVSFFGGASSADRNRKVARLMDLGFREMPSRADVRRPPRLDMAALMSDRPRTVRSSRPIRTASRPVLRSDLQQIGRAVASISDAVALVAEVPPQTDVTPMRPRPRPGDAKVASANPPPTPTAPTASTRQPRTGSWSVHLGAVTTRTEAEQLLVTSMLQDMEAFEAGQPSVVAVSMRGQTLYRARFKGLSQSAAEVACARLAARDAECTAVGP